ncbi:hypothetical protein DES40_0565 [Litorimonas taeanensis]|uniref:Uncharacterized protein n=1 Tax=Litorimonas taeanensis TaxID=568099 RepID=A0A420WJZ7_9PROT|nr:hypothetical protein [Litorimonas taeanensis]RKQ71252.1 hypothetical protein DES40_0565 [Litorimonas taeanensis]
MTKIEDMSEPQRQSWITLLADGAVFIWFWKHMTGNFGLTPKAFTPSELGVFFIQFIIITIIVHTGIAIAFELRKRKAEFQKDERDIDIARRGSHAGYRGLQIGLGIIVVTLILQYIVGSDYHGAISVIEPVEMVFALCGVSYLADLYRHAVILWGYRS